MTNFFAVGADGTKILKPNKAFNPKFFFYYLKALTIPSLGYSRHYKILNNIEVPLPPLPTQHRIVSKLDTLFGHLDALKIRLDRIPQLLKAFRQSVLTQAVTGKLTEEWREGKELEEWENQTSIDLFDYVTSGSRGWAAYYSNEGEIFLRITNINPGTLELDLREEKIQRVKLESNTEGTRTRVKVNDILVSITGDVGMVAIVPKELDGKAYVNQHIALIRLKEVVIPKFIATFLLSTQGMSQFQSKKRGMTKTGLTLGDIKNLEFQIPPLEEQQEIVRRVESLFAKADRIETQYQTLKAKIEQLPQALLAKAFRGELVEQLPGDGDARELLEEIKKMKGEIGERKNVVGLKKLKVVEELKQVAEAEGKYEKR